MKVAPMKPLFSVIIPSFNRAWALPRSIESVLCQTLEDFELILVDDGSTDETPQVLNSYARSDDRIKIITSKNHGVSHARNCGITSAKGQWLAFLDSDDEWLEDKLELQLSELISSKTLWCHGSEIWIREGKELKQKKKHRRGSGDQFERSLELCCISPSTVVIQKELLNEHKFREDFPVCEDYDLWLRLTSQHRISYVEKPIIKKYGGHEDQLSHRFHSMDYWRLKSIFLTYKESFLNDQQTQLSRTEFAKKLHHYSRGLEKYANNKENISRLNEVRQWESELLN